MTAAWMTTAWILYVLVVGTLLAAGAASVASASRGRSTRWIWTGALAGLAMLAVIAPRSESLRFDTSTRVAERRSPSGTETATPRDLRARLQDARQLIGSTVIEAIAMVNARVPRSVTRPVTLGWAATSGVLLALYLVVNLRMARARRRWPNERMHGLMVRVAPLAGPAVIGLVHAEIVVPRSLLDRSSDEQRLILTHEHEHLRARDHLLLALGCLIAIALPWHPAVWFLLGRLRLAIELDCDARVLRRGAAPRSYGALLIDMAAQGTGIRVGTLALADKQSHLERRLLAMRSERSRYALLRGGGMSVVAGLLVLVACEAKVPTAAEVSQMDVASAEKSAAEANMLYKKKLDGSTDYFLNGARVTADKAHAVDAKGIGSIEIVRSEFADGRDTIFVTTTDHLPQELRELKARTAGTPGDTALTFIRMNTGSDHAASKESAEEFERAATTWNVVVDEKKLMADGMKRRVVGPEAAPLFMIDGKVATEAQFAALMKDDIRSVHVYKNREALMRSTLPAASNGIIEATTRHGSTKP